MSKQRQVLYLFSSTSKPYINDILDILFLPPGFTYRFRYDLKWVSDGLQSQDQLDNTTNEGLIVHPYLSEHKKDDVLEYRNEELIPVRKVTITEKRIIGDFVLIQFRLGSYVKFPGMNAGTRNSYHDRLEEIVPAAVPIATKYISSKLVFVGDSIDMDFVDDSVSLSTGSASTNNWTYILSHIAKFKAHIENKSLFLKFLNITNVADDSIVIPTDLARDFFGFVLEANATYRIRIVQRSFTSIVNPFNLELSVDSAVFKPIKAQTTIQGKYDVLELIVATADIDKSRYTSFVIRPEGSASRLASVTSFTCNCKIKVNSFKRNFLFAILVIGIASIGFTGVVEEGLPKLMLPLIGTALVAIASWFLRR